MFSRDGPVEQTTPQAVKFQHLRCDNGRARLGHPVLVSAHTIHRLLSYHSLVSPGRWHGCNVLLSII